MAEHDPNKLMEALQKELQDQVKSGKIPDNVDPKVVLAKAYIDLNFYDEAFELAPENPTILNLILAKLFKIRGVCKMCGQCCRNMHLMINDKFISELEEYETLCNADPKTTRWQAVGKDEYGSLLFNCKYLGADNQCLDYDNRQELCKLFPTYDEVLRPGCGYSINIDLLPGQIKNKLLLNKIIDHAKAIRLPLESYKLFLS